MSRRLVVWEASHDNGWKTVVSEQPDGCFRGLMRGSVADGFSCQSESVEEARAEALAALKRKTGHGSCSDDCSEWVLTLQPNRR
jgi:hypothetical protein